MEHSPRAHTARIFSQLPHCTADPLYRWKCRGLQTSHNLPTEQTGGRSGSKASTGACTPDPEISYGLCRHMSRARSSVSTRRVSGQGKGQGRRCGGVKRHGYLAFLVTGCVDLEIVLCGAGRALRTLAGPFLCNTKQHLRSRPPPLWLEEGAKWKILARAI